MRTPDIFSTVLTTQAGPIWEYTELNITRFAESTVEPSALVHSGRVTRVSRGMEMAKALLRPSGMWTTIAVSERAPLTAPPPPSSLFSAPARESEPRTSRFCPLVGSFSGRSSPSALSMSTPLMFPSRRLYSQ